MRGHLQVRAPRGLTGQEGVGPTNFRKDATKGIELGWGMGLPVAGMSEWGMQKRVMIHTGLS